LYHAVAPFLQDTHESVRSEALQVAGHLLRAPDLVDERQALAESLLASPATVAERSQLALMLDDWAIPRRALLSDPDPAVRACAAIASTLDDDPLPSPRYGPLCAILTPSMVGSVATIRVATDGSLTPW